MSLRTSRLLIVPSSGRGQCSVGPPESVAIVQMHWMQPRSSMTNQVQSVPHSLGRWTDWINGRVKAGGLRGICMPGIICA